MRGSRGKKVNVELKVELKVEIKIRGKGKSIYLKLTLALIELA